MPTREDTTQEPIESWVITCTGDTNRDFYSAMSCLGGSTCEVDPYYRRMIMIDGEQRIIRGRFLLLIRDQKEQQDMQDKLMYQVQRHGLRRVTAEELAAIALLEKQNTRELGGVPCYSPMPPEPPAESPSQNAHHEAHDAKAIADWSNEGCPNG